MRHLAFSIVALLCACGPRARVVPVGSGHPQDFTRLDLDQIVRDARALADDSMRGRGPWTPENRKAADFLAQRLWQIGARPVIGTQFLVPFVSERRPGDTVYNVVGVVGGRPGVRMLGITAHFDHLGVGRPDSTGDSVYNGFLDDAIGVAMSLDVARRYARSGATRPLLVMFFNLEEQGLLGSKAFVERPDADSIIRRLDLLVGVDAGSPAGEALDWQLMGGLPEHNGTRLADSLARTRGWATVASPPRAISDVFPFSQRGVPILFPIPGQRWRDYMPQDRAAAMRRFDHYHQPGDEYDPAFPLVGTRHFADWLYDILMRASQWP